MKKQTIYCPYCGSKAVLRDASFIYGSKSSGGLVYVCSHYPTCDSYVGVHPGTTTPKGTLANKELRRKRIEAHRMFDQIWKLGIRSRSGAYRWMAHVFRLESQQAHIGQLDDSGCNQLILEAAKMLHKHQAHQQAVG